MRELTCLGFRLKSVRPKKADFFVTIQLVSAFKRSRTGNAFRGFVRDRAQDAREVADASEAGRTPAPA